MKKLKLLLAFCALLLGWSNASAETAPTASTPSVGNTYYLYNPTTKLFMTTNVDLPFVRPTGSAWKLEAAAGHDGWITLRLKDNETEGCGYFWGKWWANNPAQNSAAYADERVYQLVNTSGSNYKLKSYAWGGTTSYIYINNGNEGDRSYRLACNSHEQASLAEGFTEWQFISEEDYATYMSMDYTSRISNNDFLSGVANWTLTGTGNKQAHGNTAIEYWNASAASGSFDFYQNLTSLPAGKYVLRAAMYNSTNGEGGASFVAPGQCGVYGTSNNVTKNANVSVDGTAYNIYTTEELLVPDGNLRLGFKNSATMTARWFGVDWIQLTCVGYCLSYVAENLPANGVITAGKWYKYTVPTDMNYTITATDAANIIQTTDGNQLEEGATGSAIETGDEVALTGGTVIYYKSSSDNTLTIKANEKTYSVGDVTAQSIADGVYLKSLSTLVLTYGDAVTTDDDASLALIGTPVATLKKGSSTITTGPLTADAEAKTLTATFSDVNLTINSTDYSIEIPAGAFGYEGQSTNAAYTVNFKTPIFADGDYYLKNKDNSAFFAAGNGWGTQAITTNDRGHVVSLTAMSNGKYTINTHISNGGDSHYLNGTWCDGLAAEWEFVASDGYYQINDGTNNLTAGAVGATMTLASGSDDNTKWQVMTAAEWKAENVARLAAATASNGVDATFYLAAPKFNRNDNEENAKWQGDPGIGGYGDGTSSNFNGQKYNTNPFDVYQELTGLKPGVYKLTMNGFYRNGTTDDRNAILYANSYETKLVNIRSTKIGTKDDGKGFTTANGDYFVPNTQAEAAHTFDNSYYGNELDFTVGDDGVLRIGVKKSVAAAKDWTVFDNFQLTYYGQLDYSALQTAYDAIEVPTLGFENGEYAPYVNAANLQNMAKAKDYLDNETALTQDAINDLKDAITGMTWTANSGKVSAIYWADYTSGDKAGDGYIHPLGWTNTGYNTRIYSEAAGNKESNTGISAVNNLAMMSKYNTTYGETTGYTMPLKAATIYKITFKYCGWGNNPTTNIVLTDPESNPITLAPGFKPATNNGNTNAENWYSYTGYFVSTTAGNYVLAMNKVDGGQQQIGIGDIELVSASEIVFADGSVPTYAPGTYPTVKITRTLTADRWATAVYPFAVSGVDNIAVLDSYDSETGELGFTSAAASTANEPFLMRSTAGTTEISLSNVAVAATVANPVATKSEASLKGAYTATNITNAEKNYVLSSNQIFSVGDAGATINPYRAYIQLSGAGAARAIRFVVDGQITGVDNVKAASETEVKDGKYLENGKIVIVKNGQKFNAAGAQVK